MRFEPGDRGPAELGMEISSPAGLWLTLTLQNRGVGRKNQRRIAGASAGAATLVAPEPGS